VNAIVIAWDAVVAPSACQVSSELGDEVVILHVDNGIYHGLDAIGARIWNLMNERRTTGHIRDAILNEYDVTRERCEADLQSLLQELIDKGLAEMAP
jgi:hypothetical protein